MLTFVKGNQGTSRGQSLEMYTYFLELQETYFCCNSPLWVQCKVYQGIFRHHQRESLELLHGFHVSQIVHQLIQSKLGMILKRGNTPLPAFVWQGGVGEYLGWIGTT